MIDDLLTNLKMKALFKGKKSDVERTKGDEKILEATLAGDAPKLKGLIEKKKHSSLLSPDEEGRVAIFEACKLGFRDCIEVLLAAEPDVSLTDDDGHTCLHLAAERGYVECVTLLLKKGADVNAGDSKGLRPLHHAALGGHLDVLQALLAYSADIELTDKDGNTALILATKNNMVETATTLINAAANINIANRAQKTALMFACELGVEELARLLLARGAQINLKDTSGRTALAYARESGNSFIIGLLPEDADPGSQNTKTPQASTPKAAAPNGGAAGTPGAAGASATKPRVTLKDFRDLQKQLDEEREAHNKAKEENSVLKAQLSAFKPEEQGDVNFDSDDDGPDLDGVKVEKKHGGGDKLDSWNVLQKQIADLHIENKALKENVVAPADRMAQEYEIKSLRRKVTQLEDLLSNQNSDLPTVPMVVLDQLKEDNKEQVAQLEKQIAKLQRENTGGGNSSKYEAQIATYRNLLVLAYENKLAPEVTDGLRQIVEQRSSSNSVESY